MTFRQKESIYKFEIKAQGYENFQHCTKNKTLEQDFSLLQNQIISRIGVNF